MQDSRRRSCTRAVRRGLLALALGACAGGSELSEEAGYGPSPLLPAPERSLIPTLDIAPARGWAAGERPRAAPGLAVNAYAVGLIHPRWLYVLPNGDVLVAETNGPPPRGSGPRAWVMGWAKKRAGGAVPSPDRISLLRDADGDGSAELRTIFLEGLNSPLGMVLIGEDLYVANTDALIRCAYRADATRISAPVVPVTDLPASGINRHWTRNVIASPDGAKLYVSVGSNSNVAENGLEGEAGRAAILEIDRATGRTRVFAEGLRNPVGLAWHPRTGVLWTVVNERDEIGNDLVPDYLTSVVDGGFYGWPFSYFGSHVDERMKPQRPDLVARAIVPDYAVGAHTASLGLAFAQAPPLSERFSDGAFVGQHGSWNRKPLSGYKVIFVPFAQGRPSGPPRDVLTGFVDDAGNAHGRPVGVAIDQKGALLVADDVGNVVWRVTPARSTD